MNTKIKLRRYIGFDIKELLEKDPIGLVQSCVNCKHFNEEKEVCTVFYDQRPPARVIAFSCDSYSDIDEIPF